MGWWHFLRSTRGRCKGNRPGGVDGLAEGTLGIPKGEEKVTRMEGTEVRPAVLDNKT